MTSVSGVEFGLVLREEDMLEWGPRLPELTAAIAEAGIDRVTVGDHVSFGQGHGVDGLIQAAALLAAHASLAVQTGVYLVGLRHPAVVARQLATLAMLGPGRFEFGIGVGGDDPAELRLCGVDPATRGARTTESIELVRRLLTGEETTFTGTFFMVERAIIRPAPPSPIPLLIGARADAAPQRVGRLGDGWLAVWISPRRYRAGVAAAAEAAERCGRDAPAWRHTLQLWAGFDATPEEALARIRPVLEDSYGIPFERFERYTPCGRPADVAAALEPYLLAGCRRFNVVPVAEDLEAAIAGVAELRELVRGRVGVTD